MDAALAPEFRRHLRVMPWVRLELPHAAVEGAPAALGSDAELQATGCFFSKCACHLDDGCAILLTTGSLDCFWVCHMSVGKLMQQLRRQLPGAEVDTTELLRIVRNGFGAPPGVEHSTKLVRATDVSSEALTIEQRDELDIGVSRAIPLQLRFSFTRFPASGGAHEQHQQEQHQQEQHQQEQLSRSILDFVVHPLLAVVAALGAAVDGACLLPTQGPPQGAAASAAAAAAASQAASSVLSLDIVSRLGPRAQQVAAAGAAAALEPPTQPRLATLHTVESGGAASSGCLLADTPAVPLAVPTPAIASAAADGRLMAAAVLDSRERQRRQQAAAEAGGAAAADASGRPDDSLPSRAFRADSYVESPEERRRRLAAQRERERADAAAASAVARQTPMGDKEKMKKIKKLLR